MDYALPCFAICSTNFNNNSKDGHGIAAYVQTQFRHSEVYLLKIKLCGGH